MGHRRRVTRFRVKPVHTALFFRPRWRRSVFVFLGVQSSRNRSFYFSWYHSFALGQNWPSCGRFGCLYTELRTTWIHACSLHTLRENMMNRRSHPRDKNNKDDNLKSHRYVSWASNCCQNSPKIISMKFLHKQFPGSCTLSYETEIVVAQL